jgi:sec-independent protein translocase protein TatA
LGSFGLGHLIILGLIVFFFFGRNRLPEIGRTLGRTVKGFKEGLNDVDADSRPVKELSEDTTQAASKKKEKNKKA